MSMRAYRVIFCLAAIYNFAFGVWAGFFPRAFFSVFDLEPLNYPSIWSCLGMVVGLYGVIYAYAALEPERSDVLIGVGLVGKVLGPIGWLTAVSSGELPPRTFPLILANDLVWWFPFLFFLLRRVASRRAVIAWVGVAIHVVASIGLLAVSGGTEAEPQLSARAEWVAGSAPLWTATWFVWALASMSLLAFVTVWIGHLRELGVSRTVTTAGWMICAVGLLFDLAGETVNICWLTRPGLSLDEFERGARLYAILGAAAANGLYCVAGLLLSGVSWRAGFLCGGVGVLGCEVWIVGLCLTVATIFDQWLAMLATGGAVMATFIPWAAIVGWRMRRPARTADVA